MINKNLFLIFTSSYIRIVLIINKVKKSDQARELLSSGGLKITPQRIAVLSALIQMRNHPTADEIIDNIRNEHPNIAVGTIYKILDTLVAKGLIERVKTSRDIMRYDAMLEKHHHIYCAGSDRIDDYFDDELDNLLSDYFSRREIPGFSVEDIKLQILGRFNSSRD